MEYQVMKLHEDPVVFSELITATAAHIGLPEIYVEKDYWVTKALKHLSESDFRDITVFKGGTSLSKAYRIIDRFSEDIKSEGSELRNPFVKMPADIIK